MRKTVVSSCRARLAFLGQFPKCWPGRLVMPRACLTSLLELIADRAPAPSVLATGAAWSVPVLAELFEPGVGRLILSRRRQRASVSNESPRSPLSMSIAPARVGDGGGGDRREGDRVDPENEVEPRDAHVEPQVEPQVNPETEVPPVEQTAGISLLPVVRARQLAVLAAIAQEPEAERARQMPNATRTRPPQPARVAPRYLAFELSPRFAARRATSVARIKRLRDASGAERFR